MPFDSFSVWSGSLRRQYGWAEEEERWRRWRGGRDGKRWRKKKKRDEEPTGNLESKRAGAMGGTGGLKKMGRLKEGKKGRGETRREVSPYVKWTMEERKEGSRRGGELLVTHQGLETNKAKLFSPFFCPPSIPPSPTNKRFSYDRKSKFSFTLKSWHVKSSVLFRLVKRLHWRINKFVLERFLKSFSGNGDIANKI